MNDNQKYYLTTSNFRKLVFKSQIEVGEDIFEAYRQVFEGADLEPYVSHKEVKVLLKSILFLQKSEDALAHLEQESKARAAQRKRLDSPSRFLFLTGTPKYHTDNRCETLRADFENFEVPDEIVERGNEEVRRFRKFAQENRKLLSEQREDVFQMRLRSAFRLTRPLGKISAPNSGTTLAGQMKDSLAIDQVVARIHSAITKLETFRQTDEGKRAIKAYMYASTKVLFEQTNLSDVDRELLETKRDLISLVLQYHVMKHRGGAVTFSAKLLGLYGFEPCGVCCPGELML
jgi:hypothetical protein